MNTEEMSLLPAAKRIADARGLLAKAPATCDALALRVCRADFTSSRGFRWPFPGKWAKCSTDRSFTHADPCPSFVGDGLCLARTWAGAASGGMRVDLVLLVGYATKDVLGESPDKMRVKRAFVVDCFTFADLTNARSENEALNLRGANLYGANLYGADLRGADLRGANLCGTNLRGANLRGANLYGANLYGADLYGANLRGANLRGANLYGANLRGANLYGADLCGADLCGADLCGADLCGAVNKDHAYGLTSS